MTVQPILLVRNLAKRYGGVVALDDMNLAVEAGTIHAVVGENGAGKSTLMKVLAGVVRPDAGVVELDGKIVSFSGTNAAREHGIGMVYQELSLFPERSVLANLFVNREPVRRGLVSLTEMEARSSDLLRQLGLDVDVRAPVSRLSIGERQLVELARVMLERPRLLILDEPNSALNSRETERLFGVLRRLRAGGITMLYVSHRLEEVFSICDRITITRNGRDVRTDDTSTLTIPAVIEGMIGRQREDLFPPPLPQTSDTQSQLTVSNLSGGRLDSASFTARSGEIVGLAGLEGSGVSELLDMLFGMRKSRGGEVRFPDGQGLPRSATDAARRRVCLVPSDRRRDGLMLDKSILFNLSNVAVGARRGSPLYSARTALERARRQIDALRIKGAPSAPANSLSGGNQQKIVIGKWLEIGPQVFLLDDPTRGVDVGAKREIYSLIRRMSAGGGIVLFSSTELPELIGLCDRILVVYQGRLIGEATGSQMSEHTVLHMMNTGELLAGPQQTPSPHGTAA
ncbi:MAG: sugar ABC transporter ATP-binding protein [Mesorhizobium sp.]|nr:sugar ABC transporter ATP-binding protein [Mesorhizobium sp.]MBL8579938.1 sugar ABC transporter ATP-binding protein [Mesorhizobium sp.]